MDYEREVTHWINKHPTPESIEWAIYVANAYIASLTEPDGIVDEYELAVWKTRLPILRTKALLLGLTLPEFTDDQTP